MKHIHNRIVSLILASAVGITSTAAVSASADDSTDDVVTVSFEYEGDGITIEDDAVIETITSKPNSSVYMPKAILEKEGYSFSGWTADGFRGYAPGDALRLDTKDLTFKPVWLNEEEGDIFHVNYVCEVDGQTIDISEDMPPQACLPGSFHTVSLYGITGVEGKKHVGWIYNDEIYRGESRIVMPDHDITLTAKWYNFRKMTYLPGDVDGLLGATMMQYEYVETFSTDLQASNRFSRIGYKLTGWYCENDGKTYSPLSGYIMPEEDVVMYAVWKPINYAVVFSQGKSGKDNIIVKGDTGTTITVPEPTITVEGSTFGGWQFGDEIYQPGDEFLVRGAEPGIGIQLKAIWNSGSTTTTTTTTVTTTSTTVTSSTSTTPPDTSGSEESAKGDANCDDRVNLADAVLIMQYKANPSKYELSEQGAKNGDVADTGDGITNKDALLIQQFLLGLTEL